MKAGDEGLLVAMAVAGKSLSEIAKACHLSISSVQRRLKDPAVLALITEGRTQQREQHQGRLGGMREHAFTRLDALVDSEDERTALRAIATVLDVSMKFDMLHDLEVRIAAVEAGAEQDAVTGTGEAGDEFDFEEPVDTGAGVGGDVG